MSTGSNENENENTIKMITLIASDGQSFEVEDYVVCESETINNIIEDGCSDNGIPLPNVTGSILAKVLQYCKKHVETDTTDKVEVATLKKWDSDFMKIDQVTLYDLIMASNYLNVKGLLDLTCQTVANMIKGRNPEEIRKVFGIVNDFTPEQEEEIRKENEWAFE